LRTEFGNQADRVVAEARERAATLEQDRVPDALRRAQEAVTFAKDRGFEREAVTDERAIMRDALRRGMGDLTYSQVRDNFDQRHGSGEFKIAPGQKHETGRQFTTRETIAAELATVGHMQRGQNIVAPIMSKEAAATHAATREFLNPAQRRAIEEVLTSHDRVHGLQGLAGTGKTTTLEAIREGAERSGYAVEGFAPTSRAAAQLRDAGLTAGTLQGFLARGGQDQFSGDPTAATYIWWMNPVWPAPARCRHSWRRSGRKIVCCSSATRASIRASMLANPSSRCSRRDANFTA
jgi:hypothetical protein